MFPQDPSSPCLVLRLSERDVDGQETVRDAEEGMVRETGYILQWQTDERAKVAATAKLYGRLLKATRLLIKVFEILWREYLVAFEDSQLLLEKMVTYRKSMLFSAIRSNDIQAVQSILSTKRAQWSFNGTDFHMVRKSIEYKRKDITKLLLDHGCRVNLPSFVGDSPLHLAVAKPRCYSLVKRLLELGADVSHRNQLNETPIQYAFASGAEEKVVRLLLQAYLKKGTLNVTDDDGLSYLHMACATADLDLVRKLVEQGGADVNARVNEEYNLLYAGSTPLHIAVEFGNSEVIEYLLEQGANVYTPDYKGSTPIHLALEFAETGIIGLLFEYDDERMNFCNDNGLSHFMAACACSCPEIAEDFLADKFIDGEFMNANEVIDSPEDPDYWLKGFTPLHFAAFFGRLEMTKLLIAYGANCCAITSSNVTPIQLAENNGHKIVADFIKAHCQGYDWFF